MGHTMAQDHGYNSMYGRASVAPGWRIPLTLRGVPRMVQLFLGFIATVTGGVGWACPTVTIQNQFFIATGSMITIISAIYFYYEGKDQVFLNIFVPAATDFIFFILSFAASVSSITDIHAAKCGYENIKAASIMMFLIMTSLGCSMLLSINDLLETDESPEKSNAGASAEWGKMSTETYGVQEEDQSDNAQNVVIAPADNDLPPGWTVHTTDQGYEYYFHGPSGKSQWQKPAFD